jgi:putative FmdB family regulatory protein
MPSSYAKFRLKYLSEVLMPFYEYVCTNCGAATEILQKLSDPPATRCLKCHAEALTKQISAAGFRLKGGGWYETDFKSAGQRNLVGASGESAASDGAEAAPAAEQKSGAEASKPAVSKAGDSKSSSKDADSKPVTPSPSKPSAAPAT